MTDEAVQSFFDSYVDAFNRNDVDAVMKQWTFPATISIPAATHVLDGAAFQKNTQALCDFYRRQGMVEARKRVSSIHHLGPNVANVTTEDVLYDADGKPIASWQHGYVLRETDGRIHALMAVADGEIEAWAARGTPLGS